jgi:hypothetical protein
VSKQPVDPNDQQGGMNAKAYDVTGIDLRIRYDSTRITCPPTRRPGTPRYATCFTWKHFTATVNNDLADTLGNFVNRALSFCKKRFGGEPAA